MKYRRVWPHVFFVILAGAFILLSDFGLNSGFKQDNIIQSPSIKAQVIPTKETARVSRVVDGDTVKVLINNEEKAIRLIGIDSPEILDERKPIQCFGKEASAKAKEMLNGKTITLESDPTQGERDEYERLLRYVFLNDLNFNKFMISEGYAREYTFKGNPYKYQSDFIQVEKKAKKEKKGLWGTC